MRVSNSLPCVPCVDPALKARIEQFLATKQAERRRKMGTK